MGAALSRAAPSLAGTTVISAVYAVATVICTVFAATMAMSAITLTWSRRVAPSARMVSPEGGVGLALAALLSSPSRAPLVASGL